MSYTSHHTSQCERATFQVLSSVCNANSTTAVCIAFEVLLRSDALDMLGQVSILLSLSFVTCKPSPPQPRWPCPRVLACFPQAFADACRPVTPGLPRLFLCPPTQLLPNHSGRCWCFIPILLPSALTPVEGLKKTRAGFCVKHFKSLLHLSVWINVWVPLCGIHSSHDLGICASWKVSLSLCG